MASVLVTFLIGKEYIEKSSQLLRCMLMRTLAHRIRHAEYASNYQAPWARVARPKATLVTVQTSNIDNIRKPRHNVGTCLCGHACGFCGIRFAGPSRRELGLCTEA
jgi:hypothetical protein